MSKIAHTNSARRRARPATLETAFARALRHAGLAPAEHPEPEPPAARKDADTPPKQPRYRYRCLPCTIAPDDQLWYVEGVDERGGVGVLEWCFDEPDAAHRLNLMRAFKQFSRLAAKPFDPSRRVNALVAETLGMA